MQSISIIMLFVIASLSGLSHNVKEISNMESNLSAEELEVLTTVESFNKAFASNDPQTYFTFIDNNITVFTPTNPYRVEGISPDREEFEFSLKKGLSKVGYFQQLQTRVQLLGDVAVVTYYSRGSYGPNEVVAYYKETDILVKRDRGWKIIHIHVSKTS